jgi:exosortase/archaeosortase family protein
VAPRLSLLGVQLVAFWPVWVWYGSRLRDASEAAGVVVTLLAAILLPGEPRGPSHAGLLPAAAATAAYAVAFPFAPDLVRALLALLSLACLRVGVGASGSGVARVGLFLLAAPIVPSLQFYLGYPLRLAVGHGAAAWLRGLGLGVRAEGAGLAFSERLVFVDAPCSGVVMLWGTLFVALASALLFGRGARATLGLCSAALALSVVGNSLRAAGLFLDEAEIVQMPESMHDAAGLAVFGLTAAALGGLARWRRGDSCAV